MKFKIIITSEIEVDLKDYPGAKTIDDVVKMEREYIANSDYCVHDLINEKSTIEVEC